MTRALSSTTSAKAHAPLFGGFIGTMARSHSSGAYLSGLWLWAFPDRSRSDRDAPEVSRFSCLLFRGVPGVFDYAGSSVGLRIAPTADVAFPQTEQGRHPNLRFRSSIPCPPVPLSTLRLPPHDDRCKTRGLDGRALRSRASSSAASRSTTSSAAIRPGKSRWRNDLRRRERSE